VREAAAQRVPHLDGLPTVSVVVCAYTEKRWEDLVAAIDSCRAQTYAPIEAIVAVDHNPGLLERLRSERPDVVAVENREQPGLSGARNSGARAARGEVVAFLDDDAVAAPDWLEFLVEAYADASVIGVGGRIDPVWPERRPAGLPPEFDWVVGCTYRGLPTERSAVRNMIGANMSLRSDVLASIGGFRSDLGRIGNRPLGCEETELCIRALQSMPGAAILYEPRARVHHRVTPERTRWRYFHSRCYSEGLSKAAVAAHAGKGDGLSSERRYALRTLPSGLLRSAAEALRDRDLAGVVRGLAIITGLLVTTVGYTVGLVRGAAAAGSKA
jgi:glycosyltransferase involved in cell wall biosynthesis